MACFALPVNCSGSELSSSSKCWKVASFAKKWVFDASTGSGNMLAKIQVNAMFLKDFATCITELYRLYKRFDWAVVKKNIPSYMMSFIKKVVSEIVKNPSPAAKVALPFISANLFFTTLSLHSTAGEFAVISDAHRKEFEHLQTRKIQPILNQIDRDIVPLLEGLNVATSIPLTIQAIESLGYHNSELTILLRKVYKDHEIAEQNKDTSLRYSYAGVAVCVASFLIGQPYLATLPCGGAALSVYNAHSYDETARKLRILIADTEKLSNDIDRYVKFLHVKFQSVAFVITIIFLVLVVFVVLLLCLAPFMVLLLYGF